MKSFFKGEVVVRLKKCMICGLVGIFAFSAGPADSDGDGMADAWELPVFQSLEL